jgi:hypothetical protein
LECARQPVVWPTLVSSLDVLCLSMVNLPVLWTLELSVGQIYWDLLAMSILVF